MNLVVLQPFGSYKKGDQIQDKKEVAAILKSEMVQNVVKVASAPEASPVAAKK